MKKKNSIKRAQSQAGLSFAERLRVGELCSGMRKNFRPMAKILTLLVLLMTAVTGAWAQEETLLTTIVNTGDNASFKSGSKTFDNIATVTFSGKVYNDNDYYGWYSYDQRTLTVTAAEGYTITRVKFFTKSNSAFDEEAPFEAIMVCEDEENYITKVNGTSIGTDGVTKIEVYGYAPAPPVTDYYLVGNMTSWGINPQYKLALNESAGDANEYQIAVALPAATELKVVSSTDGSTINDWYPAGQGNDKYVQNDGLYTIYFRPGYNGPGDWHANCIYVADGVSFTADGEAWTLAQMPACDLELEMEYYPLATLATLPAAAEGLNDATTADLLTPGTSTEGTLYYALGTSEAPTGQWSTDIPTTQGLEAGEYYVWYKVVGDAEHSDSQPQSIAVTVAALPTYAVTIDDAGVDASNWQATPAEQRAGQTVTLSYGGKKKIRSITIEAAAEPAGNVVDMSTLEGDYEAQNGDVLSGSTSYSVTIADNATVTLNGVTMNGGKFCIGCAGSATIILKDGTTNTLTSTSQDYPALWAGDATTTLTIQGNTGVLNVTSGHYCAGIGGGYKNTNSTCGNIRIEGSVITAQGGWGGSGIGSDAGGNCGDIIITGGTITAKGGSTAAGIGTGNGNGSPAVCGDITIANTVTKVTATKGESAPYSIGKGYGGSASCGTITIGGTGYGTDGISDSPFTYEP